LHDKTRDFHLTSSYGLFRRYNSVHDGLGLFQKDLNGVILENFTMGYFTKIEIEFFQQDFFNPCNLEILQKEGILICVINFQKPSQKWGI
jgi:hypothetical protein